MRRVIKSLLCGALAGAVAILGTLDAPGQESTSRGPNMDYAKAMVAFERVLAESAPPIDKERCGERLRSVFVKTATGTAKERESAQADLARLREDKCINDPHFRVLHVVEPPVKKHCDSTITAKGETTFPDPPVELRDLPDGLTLIRVRDFTWYDHRCPDYVAVIKGMLRRVVRELKEDEARDSILDLRDNLGGWTYVLWEFINEMFSPASGKLAMMVQKRDNRMESYYTEKAGTFPCPRAVLINRRTASAAEIVSGILRTLCSETIFVGEKTYGKGTATPIIREAGLFVKFSVLEYFVGEPPDLTKINGIGINPDVVVVPEISLSAHKRPNPWQFVPLSQWTFEPLPSDKILDAALSTLKHRELFFALKEKARRMRQEMQEASAVAR